MAERKESLMDKKVSELTADQFRSLMKPIGLPGLPYPMAKLSKTADGSMEHDVGVIESAQNPLIMYSEQSMERINGMLFRQMPIPGMMFMLRDLLKKIEPESKNRIMTVFGDAAFGKSHLFKLVGNLVHPEGPIAVDCGGMNMRELFFRTVIDYGAGVKEQFEQRVSKGQVSETSLKALEEQFPGAVVQKDDKTFIDWHQIGQPRKKGAGVKEDEDRGDAMRRAAQVMKDIYEKEGIDVQSNAFGIKMVPGEVFESIESGRPLFLDEFNKSKAGTLDTFQTFLQFANGEIDEVTLYNPMGSTDDDSPKSITITRDMLKPGWHMGIAGNDKSDGSTTQELSVSMMTRLNPLRIGEPSERDWRHRISQVWTGMPLVTLYNLFEGTAKAKPAEFANFLIEMRKLGLSAQEVKAIPPHEIYFLQNFQETVTAVNQVSNYYADRLKLADPESPMLNQKAYENLADEIAADGDKIFVSFRKVIADFNRAVEGMAEVRDAKAATLSLNLSEVFKSVDLSSVGKTMPGWHRFGANMVQAIQEDIVNDTIGMPRTRAALLTLCENNGIFAPEFKEGKESKSVKPLPELLKYDGLKDLGGTDELMELRGVLMACLKSQYKNLKQSDDNVIPLENLGRALQELKGQKEESPQAYIVPNDDLNNVNGTPLLSGRALPIYDLEDPENSDEYTLVDFRAALAGLAVPEYADENRKRIWPVSLHEFVTERPTEPADIEAFNTLEGKSEVGFNITVLAAADSKKNPAYLFLIEDRVQLGDTMRQKLMVVGPEDISPQLQSELTKNGVSYVVKSDKGTEQKINDFLAEGARIRGEEGKLAGDTEKVIEGLIKAFSAVCELSDTEQNETNPSQMIVGKGTTLGHVIHNTTSTPSVYTSIVKPKMAGG
ncbi:MAG: hypothetical protein GC185_06545 [Alphaproteobacteria bacterium]|nr:hypothetical protein [Alphaproteobacteria bacterium]